MDAKERLRRYLEQRREQGERELILDGMSVEDAMKLISAAPPGAAAAPRTKKRAAAAEPPPAELEPPAPEAPIDATAADYSSAGDWRALLRSSGAAPKADDAEPARRRESTRQAGDAAPSRDEAQRVAEQRQQQPADRARDREAAAPTPDETRQAARSPRGMEPSSAPGAATPAAAEGRAAPLPDEGARVPGVAAPAGLVVGQPSTELFSGPIGSLGSLEEVAATIAKCTRCPLYSTATNPVPGEGSSTAEVVCVGEAPGEKEDLSGRPFVGASGELLTKILAAISLARADVFIVNVLKHRPPGNRNPRPEEVEACSPYLVRQLELLRPKVILCFGTFAAQTLLNTKLPIGKLRGSIHRYYGTPLIVTYHPAALLRNPSWKRPTWEDVQLARRILDSAAGA